MDSRDQIEHIEANGQLLHARVRNVQQAAEVVRRDPGPLGEALQHPLVGGPEERGKKG